MAYVVVIFIAEDSFDLSETHRLWRRSVEALKYNCQPKTGEQWGLGDPGSSCFN